MKEKLLIVLILLTFCMGFLEATNFNCMFTLINPSAADIAFGLKSGTANIWNTSPLGVWSNPAKLGYHRNLAAAYSNGPWFEDTFDDMYHSSSYISYGWKGIGVMFPAPAKRGKWGILMDYGKSTITGEDPPEPGEELPTCESYDHSASFAVGINSLEFVSNLSKNPNFRVLKNYSDISIGYNYDMIRSDLTANASVDTIEAVYGDTHSSGLGYILRISPFNDHNAADEFYRLDLTAGTYHLNPTKTNISYSDNSEGSLPYGTRTAFAGRFTITSKLILEQENSQISNLLKNFLSIYYSQDNNKLGSEDNSTWGEGWEITFLDFFSIRRGYYLDREGEIRGKTSGYGFNLQYKDLFQFQYNTVKFPGGGLQAEQEKWDLLFRADFVSLYKEFSG